MNSVAPAFGSKPGFESRPDFGCSKCEPPFGAGCAFGSIPGFESRPDFGCSKCEPPFGAGRFFGCGPIMRHVSRRPAITPFGGSGGAFRAALQADVPPAHPLPQTLPLPLVLPDLFVACPPVPQPKPPHAPADTHLTHQPAVYGPLAFGVNRIPCVSCGGMVAHMGQSLL